MPEIKKVELQKLNDLSEIKKYRFFSDWPIVYILNNKNEAYIGESHNFYSRIKQHKEDQDKKRLTSVQVISDEFFNKSATLDIESSLIQYMAADGKFLIQNKNSGLKDHSYYDKERYGDLFEKIWERLVDEGFAQHTLGEIKNSDLFKYSPYKKLTDEQLFIARRICNEIQLIKENTYIINGQPGTGKTILAIYLFKYLSEKDDTKHMKIGLVVPMTSLRKTIKDVFGNIKGLKKKMVIGPNDVIKEKYDLLIVDEAHRLQRRRNITNIGAFDIVNEKLNLSKTATQLDWVMQAAPNRIFFYDKNQSIKPADVRPEDFQKINAKEETLHLQMRIKNGLDYYEAIDNFFELNNQRVDSFEHYDFRIYDSLSPMINQIKERNKSKGLSRMVAGYAWPWHTKNDNNEKGYDIDVDGLKLIWNSTAKGWVNSPNAINEIGCIHTVQGYDLNYVGVIIGPEFSYDFKKNKFIVNKEHYFDINGHKGISDISELEGYIKNIYKTLLTRGIEGTYLYIVDHSLRKYFKDVFSGSDFLY